MEGFTKTDLCSCNNAGWVPDLDLDRYGDDGCPAAQRLGCGDVAGSAYEVIEAASGLRYLRK